MNTMENDMQNDTTERSATAKKSLLDGWNAPPNLVTYSRIVLVVIFLGLYIAAGSWGENNIPMRWAAAVLFIVAASTDKVDGWMARKYNQVTELGKLMDPIADKAAHLRHADRGRGVWRARSRLARLDHRRAVSAA